jgi:hypothetical protein
VQRTPTAKDSQQLLPVMVHSRNPNPRSDQQTFVFVTYTGPPAVAAHHQAIRATVRRKARTVYHSYDHDVQPSYSENKIQAGPHDDIGRSRAVSMVMPTLNKSSEAVKKLSLMTVQHSLISNAFVTSLGGCAQEILHYCKYCVHPCSRPTI